MYHRDAYEPGDHRRGRGALHHPRAVEALHAHGRLVEHGDPALVVVAGSDQSSVLARAGTAATNDTYEVSVAVELAQFPKDVGHGDAPVRSRCHQGCADELTGDIVSPRADLDVRRERHARHRVIDGLIVASAFTANRAHDE